MFWAIVFLTYLKQPPTSYLEIYGPRNLIVNKSFADPRPIQVQGRPKYPPISGPIVFGHRPRLRRLLCEPVPRSLDTVLIDEKEEKQALEDNIQATSKEQGGNTDPLENTNKDEEKNHLPNMIQEIVGGKEVWIQPDHLTPIRKPVNSEGSFNLYISGIDTYGDITKVSRSDVNKILTVNPNTRKILITTIPRDSYVKIPGGGQNQYDKLTHSGLYGVGASMEALENLFDIDINYYGRINFDSLIDIVDVLGGIDVDNPVAFKSGNMYFKKGRIHLNGERALRFSRERYHLKEGDLDRGRNQERVIKGIVEKGVSPEVLFNYSKVLEVVSRSAEMNMPKNEIIAHINDQMANNSQWEIESTEVTGKARRDLPSFAEPSMQLYMYELDQKSVDQARGQMLKVMNGQ